MKISIFYGLRLDNTEKKRREGSYHSQKYVLHDHFCVYVCQAYNEIIDYELLTIKMSIHTHKA